MPCGNRAEPVPALIPNFYFKRTISSVKHKTLRSNPCMSTFAMTLATIPVVLLFFTKPRLCSCCLWTSLRLCIMVISIVMNCCNPALDYSMALDQTKKNEFKFPFRCDGKKHPFQKTGEVLGPAPLPPNSMLTTSLSLQNPQLVL